MSASRALGRQFAAVADLHPKTSDHPSTFIGDDESYNGKLNDPDNPAPAYERLKKDIQKRGVRKPLLVEEVEGKLHVGDGHHRLQAAKELGITHVPVRHIR